MFGDWLLSMPVIAMAALIMGAIYLATAGLYLLVTRLATSEEWARAFKAISAGVLSPLAVIFALLVGFLAAQVWNDGDRAHGAVNREASALRAVVLLSAAFPDEPATRISDLVRHYIQDAVTQEWPAMATHHATLTLAPPHLAEALRVALALEPAGPGQVAAQREMVGALETALDTRRQRIILSRSAIDWVKWTVLLAQAGLTLLTIAMVHADNPRANRIILGIFATGVGAAVVLIASHSRPFTGEIAVSPSVLLQIMPEGLPGRP